MSRAPAVGLLLLCLFAAPDAWAQEEDPALRQRTDRLLAELEQLGFEVDGGAVRVELRSAQACLDDLDRQQDLFFPASYWEGNLVLRKALGILDLDDPARLRKLAVRGMAQSNLSVYYQPDRKALVIQNRGLFQLGDQDYLVAHELAHAYQDQRHGLGNLMRLAPRTTEAVQLVRALMEGQAECAATAVLLARRGLSLGDVEPDSVTGEQATLQVGPEQALIYTMGTRYLLEQRRALGSEGVRDCFSAIPPSSEQLLHASKRGHDVPVTVTLPARPGDLKLGHEDVLGELTWLGVLLTAGVDPQRAALAVAGWDGELLRVYRGPRGRALVWRSVWDRSKDATQMAEVLTELSGSQALAKGRLLEWVWADDAADLEILWAALAGSPELGDGDPEDARTTTAIEREIRAEARLAPRVERERWLLPKAGVSLPLRSGWEVRDVNGTQAMLHAMPGDEIPFADNVTVLRLPAAGATLDQVAEATRQQLTSAPNLELIRLELAEVSEQPVLWVEYAGTQPGVGELHFLVLAVIRSGQQVILTATVAAPRWADFEPEIRAVFEGFRFERAQGE